MKNRTLICLVLIAGLSNVPAATTHNVDMINFTFSPANASIQVADTVRWTQRDALTSHTSTSGEDGLGNGMWDSGLLNQGATFSHTFSSAGSFPYFCGPHFTTMIGSVTVSGGNTPPTVMITSPTGGTSFFGPTNLTIQANATDDGSVARVQFFDGATSVGFDASSPYSNVTHFAVGNHTLTAVATDNLGVRATSAPVNITISSPPPPTQAGITNITVATSNVF